MWNSVKWHLSGKGEILHFRSDASDLSLFNFQKRESRRELECELREGFS